MRKEKKNFFLLKFTFVSACDRLGRLPRGNIQLQIARFSFIVGVESI
jgi:hypothetical protein